MHVVIAYLYKGIILLQCKNMLCNQRLVDVQDLDKDWAFLLSYAASQIE